MRPYQSRVYINYVGSMPDGTVFDDHRTGVPLEVVIGADRVPKGVEAALREMNVGDEATLELEPDAAYGEYQSDAVFKVPINTIPHADSMPLGEHILWYGDRKKNKSNRPAIAKVVEKDDAHITIDLNHPLAGKNIVYWVKVIDEDLEPLPTRIDHALNEVRKKAEEEQSSAQHEPSAE